MLKGPRVGPTSPRVKLYRSGRRSGRSRIILRARSILMTFLIFSSSSCIIFAVVRSTFVAFALSSAFFVLSSLACVPTVF